MCITTITKLRNCGANPGGMRPKVYIARKQDVLTIPTPSADNVVDTDITFDVGGGFAVWEADQDNVKIDINSIGEGGSKAFQTTVEMHLSGFDEAFEHHLTQQLNGEFIALVQDRKDKYRIVGSLEEGAFFTSDGMVGTSGMTIEEKNGNTLKLTYNDSKRPYFYTGTITTL